jgi:hypothetical protein
VHAAPAAGPAGSVIGDKLTRTICRRRVTVQKVAPVAISRELNFSLPRNAEHVALQAQKLRVLTRKKDPFSESNVWCNPGHGHGVIKLRVTGINHDGWWIRYVKHFGDFFQVALVTVQLESWQCRGRAQPPPESLRQPEAASLSDHSTMNSYHEFIAL